MIEITVNEQTFTLDISADIPLLWLLRDHLKLTGTKFGCGAGLCGACTIHLDGMAVRSCQVTLGDVNNRQITTIEGISQHSNAPHSVQKAWQDIDVPQCGFCQPGQIMSAIALLTKIPNPTDNQIVQAMAGNICRCGTYVRIKAAIKNAAHDNILNQPE